MKHQKSIKKMSNLKDKPLVFVLFIIRKAQEYYIKDLCLNTRRFDSWAGLTVIEFYKIEEFITVSISFMMRVLINIFESKKTILT